MSYLDNIGLSHFLDKLKTIFPLLSSKGAANGIASLDESSKIPIDQLPSVSALINIIDDVSSSQKTILDGTDDKPVAVKIAITPLQSGEGIPTPNNIRQITGWTEAVIARTGPNLLDETIITIIPGKYIDITDGSIKSANNFNYVEDYILIESGTTYSFSVHKTATSYARAVYALFYDENKALQGYEELYSATTSASDISTTLTIPNGIQYVRFNLPSFSSGTLQFLIKGTYPIAFPSEAGIVYGGTLTVNKDGTGELVVKTAYYEFTGDVTYGVGTSSSGTKYIYSKNGGLKLESYPISNMYQGTIAGTQNNTIRNLNGFFYVYDNRFTSSEVVRQILTSTPIQAVCEIATPQKYTLTCEQVKTLLGFNKIWADTGDILFLDYFADAKLYIDKKFAELQALILENISNS